MATDMEDNGGEKDPQVVVLAQREDEDREFVRLLLEKIGGFQVIGVRSTTEVILQLQSNPALILVDPHIEGDFIRTVELMRRMPKLNHVSIALLSAERVGISRYTGKGLNGFLPKPFTPEGLMSRIWKVLDSAPPLPPDGSPAKLEVDVDTIEGLPTLPTVYAQVEQLCEDPHVDADELAKVIGADPSITMKLLKLANSAFFAFSREIKSVSDAVSLLGNETVKNVVLSISVFEATKDMEGSAGLNKEAFWRHSAACGSVVRFISKKLRIVREEGFTSGILHDIGKIILDSLYADFYKGVLNAVVERNISIEEAEDQTLGMSHAKLGHELAESWGIPSRLAEAISHHHRPGKAELDPEIASLVHIADAVCRNLGFGSGGDSLVPVIHPFAFNQVAVEPQDLVSWEEEMVQVIEKDMAFLSAIS